MNFLNQVKCNSMNLIVLNIYGWGCIIFSKVVKSFFFQKLKSKRTLDL